MDPDKTCTGIPNKKLIMWLFLASDCLFFGTLLSTHLIYRKLHPSGATEAGVVDIQGMFNLELTSFSTFILLMSSFLMALAVSAIRKGQLQSFRNNCIGVMIFGLIFIGCQVYEFQHFYEGQGTYKFTAKIKEGHTSKYQSSAEPKNSAEAKPSDSLKSSPAPKDSAANPKSSATAKPPAPAENFDVQGSYKSIADARKARKHFEHDHPELQVQSFQQTHSVPGLTLQTSIFGTTFYILTGTHGTHVAIGILWLMMLFVYSYSGRMNTQNAIDVEVAGLYWHFVDIVWIVIFTVVYLIEYI